MLLIKLALSEASLARPSLQRFEAGYRLRAMWNSKLALARLRTAMPVVQRLHPQVVEVDH
jgi:hypothetical protein